MPLSSDLFFYWNPLPFSSSLQILLIHTKTFLFHKEFSARASSSSFEIEQSTIHPLLCTTFNYLPLFLYSIFGFPNCTLYLNIGNMFQSTEKCVVHLINKYVGLIDVHFYHSIQIYLFGLYLWPPIAHIRL